MKQSLYELSRSYENIKELCQDDSVDEATIKAALAEIDEDLETKVSDGIGLIRSLEYKAKDALEESRRLAKLAHMLSSRALSIKNYYADNLRAMGKKHVDTGRGRMTIQKNPPKLVVSQRLDIDDVPEEYKKFIPASWKLDTDTIKKALGAGKHVPGCELIQEESLRIR